MKSVLLVYSYVVQYPVHTHSCTYLANTPPFGLPIPANSAKAKNYSDSIHQKNKTKQNYILKY